jgi:hypothetical protein
MAFLDFITNRQGQRPAGEQQSQQKQPDPSKELNTRGAALVNATAKRVENMRPDQKEMVSEAQSLFRKGTQETAPATTAPAPAPADGAESPQVMVQKSMNQDKVAPPQSPTSAQMGTRTTEKETLSPSKEPTEKSPQKSQEAPKPTMARTRPSYER